MPNTADTSDGLPVYRMASEAAVFISALTAIRPEVAIILGSGLGTIADVVDDAVNVRFTEIPHWLPTTVSGHEGLLSLGHLAGTPVAVLRGRLHLYEGYTPQEVVFPMRALHLLGVETAVLTNAAGGLNPSFMPGSLMLIRDHIGLPTLAGLNPLTGLNDDRLGLRFPPMNDAYDPELRQLALTVAEQKGIDLAEGVYAMVGGPNYETQAELRMLRLCGADAVGMSTVPEAIAARHMRMRVLGLSCITNTALSDAAGDSSAPAADVPTHEEVLRAAGVAAHHMATLLSHMFARIS
ncbi:MAG TPA: purine-nucleoside phosphorylase [Ktedonobacterales bacterium]|nr:purine-nucleoside phosphorylase [Ktedonobacterales bacterium]